METHKYSIIAKFIYRFANIPVTLLLLLYFFLALFSPEKTWLNGLSIVVHALLIYFINSFYIKNYKYFPYKIEIDNEKMICSDFFMQSKILEIKLADITEITGGIFSNTPARPVYFTDTVNGVKIGVNPHLKHFNKLVTKVLSNVKQDVYNDVLTRIKDYSELNTKGTIKRKK